MSEYKYDFVNTDIETGKIEFIDPDALMERLEHGKSGGAAETLSYDRTKWALALMILFALIIISVVVAGMYLT